MWQSDCAEQGHITYRGHLTGNECNGMCWTPKRKYMHGFANTKGSVLCVHKASDMPIDLVT